MAMRGRIRKALAALMLAVLVLAAWHYWTLYASLSGARGNLGQAEAGLTGLGLEARQSDLEMSRARVDEASKQLGAASMHFHFDPLIQGARLVPGIGGQVSAAEALIEMGRLVAQIGNESLRAGATVAATRDEPGASKPLAGTVVALLEDTGPSIEHIDALTSELVARRLALGDRPLVAPLDAVRRRLDAELPRLVKAENEVRQAQQLLPCILGFEGDRRYLVLALNNGELLPGGGLVSAAGVVSVSNGSNGPIDFTDSTRWKQAWESRGGDYVPPPGPLQRYLLHDYTWNLLVSDWNPDFPTWSQQALEFYELVHGPQQVAGVVALDLVVLQRLLQITGPKTIEIAGPTSVRFTPENAVLELERLTRQPFEATDDRKSVIGQLAQVLIADLQHLPASEWGSAVSLVRGLGAERHIQLFSFDPREQALIREAGWSGRMEAAAGDYLQFNEASVNSTKLNLIIAPEATYRIDVDALGDARHFLELRYQNSLPEWQRGKDPALVKQLMLGGLYGGYLRVFAPSAMTNPSARIDGVPAGIEDMGAEAGRSWAGVFMPLGPGQQSVVELKWTVPLATQRPGEYAIYIQKQAGTAGMCIDLLITRQGKAPREVVVDGGTRDSRGRICLATDTSIRAVF